MTQQSAKGVSPIISVVIPHFNRAKLLTETLDSVRAQTFPDWEVIVVDDGSNSDEWQRVQEFQGEKVRVLQRTEEPKGPSKSRNTGLQNARGEFVVFVDSDDLIAPWCFEQRLEQAMQFPENAFWVFPVMLFERHIGDVSLQWNDLNGVDDLLCFLHSDPPWHTSSPLWKRSALLQIGGFNDNIMYGDDADLHTRALLQGLPYRKFELSTPDSFVRRDDSPRITNTLSNSLMESRRTRLREGSTAVAEATAEQRLAWEGQYFSEAEFLLFNLPQPALPIRQLVSEWSAAQKPATLRWLISRAYLWTALHTKERLYIALRLARRLAMLLLPSHYFPTAPGFQNTPVSAEMLEQIKEKISNIPALKPGDVDATVSA